MSYSVYDVNGYVGDLATNSGLASLFSFLKIEGDAKVRGLVSAGSVPLSDGFLQELKDVAAPKDKDTAKTLKKLISLADQCEEILIVTNGDF